jgi:small-conductance mechanosensitive channel/CRP-like cAMP-binding protein
MSAWDRMLHFSSASPFTSSWMSLATASGALVAVLVMRRMLPPDGRQSGGATAVLLSMALLLVSFRLLLVATGAKFSVTGRVINLLTTFFVALGTVNAAILFVFEVVPARTRLRFPTIIRDIIQMLAFVVILFGSLSESGVANFVSFLTTSAVLTAVIGLALQSTIANLFAGIVLHMDRALAEGDWIQLGARTGRIAQIRWRSTILRTTDGDNVIVPNGQLTLQEVYNFSRPSPRHRVWVRAAFVYRHPPNDVRQALVEATKSTPGVLADPMPDALVSDFGDHGVVYAVRFWIQDFARRAELEGEVRTRIWYAARRAGLEISYPARALQLAGVGVDSHAADADSELATRVAALKRVDLFSGLPANDLRLLSQGMRVVRFAAGEPIIKQGEGGESMFIIAEGEVLVSLRASGLDQSITILRAGNFFGEMSLITGDPRNANCSAFTDVICHVLDHGSLQPLLAQRPAIAEHFSSLLASRQAALEKKGGELSARAAQAAELKDRLLGKIRRFFDLK